MEGWWHAVIINLEHLFLCKRHDMHSDAPLPIPFLLVMISDAIMLANIDIQFHWQWSPVNCCQKWWLCIHLMLWSFGVDKILCICRNVMVNVDSDIILIHFHHWIVLLNVVVNTAAVLNGMQRGKNRGHIWIKPKTEILRLERKSRFWNKACNNLNLKNLQMPALILMMNLVTMLKVLVLIAIVRVAVRQWVS